MNRRRFSQCVLATGLGGASLSVQGCGETPPPVSASPAPSLEPTPITPDAAPSPFDRHEVTHGAMRLVLTPGHGGSISALQWNGVDLLRPAPAEPHDILEAASFPIAPIVNRIPNATFQFEDRDVRLTPNLLDLPDFFHGQGWRSPWTLERSEEGVAVLQFIHESGEWPWRYVSRQTFSLLPSGVRMELAVKNLSDSNMPAGLGFHPYFQRTPQTRLKTVYDGYWATDEARRPQARADGSYRKDWLAGDDFNDTVDTDHTHFGFAGEAVLTDPDLPTLTLTADPTCDNLHVYAPAGGDFACVEPVTDRADPFGETPLQIRILAPEEELSIWMEINAS